MKKVILFVLLALPTVTMAQFSPYIPTSKSNPYDKDSTSIAKEKQEKQLREAKVAAGEFEYSGGTYLQKSSGSFTTSLVLAFTGAFSAGYGTYLEGQTVKPNETKPDSKPYYLAGGILGLASTVFYIRGIVLIGKAGEAFDAGNKGKTALYLQPRPNGASLVLRF